MRRIGVFTEVYKVVGRIPRGKVATYGQIAAVLGNPRLSRAVGYALHVNPYPNEVPCHRVVNRFGSPAPSFAFGGEDVQRRLLEAEGVRFGADGRVDLKLYGCAYEDLEEKGDDL